MWKSCGTQGRLRWCAVSCHVVADCGTLFSENVAVGDVALRRFTCRCVVLRRMAFGRVASRGCVVALCRGVFCVVLCGVGWCCVVPGTGFVMSRRVLFCGGWLCAVVLCCVVWCCVVFRWVAVFLVL